MNNGRFTGFVIFCGLVILCGFVTNGAQRTQGIHKEHKNFMS